MTVSRAMRQLPCVSEKTRKRIMETAARLGYLRTTRGGRKAAADSGDTVRTIQLIVGEGKKHMGRFHAELTLSLVRLLAEKHFECIIRVSDGNYKDFIKMLSAARQTDSEASLILGNFSDNEMRSLLTALPGALLLDTVGNNVFESVFSSFSFDNTYGAWLAVKHLLSCDRRRIALITGPAEHSFAHEIEKGYRDCLADNGVEVDEKLICYTDFSSRSAEEHLGALLDRHIEIDAVFTNDEMAGGVYHAILKRGLKIPADIAVCGCDGLPVGEQLYPRLTTVILDHSQLARQVVNTIMSQDLALEPVQLTLRPFLQIRESTS